MKWYYLVIAGVVVLCLSCSCLGAGAYLLLRDDSSSGLASADPTAGCEEAIRGAPADTTGEATSPELNRRWAEHFREAAAKANRPEIRSAILDEAAAWDHYADVQEEVDAKRRAGTDDVDDTLALTRALREKLAAHRQAMDVCAEAGYE
jgi:hypothetical protein